MFCSGAMWGHVLSLCMPKPAQCLTSTGASRATAVMHSIVVWPLRALHLCAENVLLPLACWQGFSLPVIHVWNCCDIYAIELNATRADCLIDVLLTPGVRGVPDTIMAYVISSNALAQASTNTHTMHLLTHAAPCTPAESS